jgi:hypothetical protein
MRRVHQAAAGFDWCGEWRTRITDNALPLVGLTRAVTLECVTAEDLDAVEDTISMSTMPTGIHRQHWLTQHRGLRALCYQLGLVEDPPVHPHIRLQSPEQRADRITQPISITHHARTITDLRCFFDDLTAWGWAERPPGCCCTAATSPGCPQHCPARCHPTSTPR